MSPNLCRKLVKLYVVGVQRDGHALWKPMHREEGGEP